MSRTRFIATVLAIFAYEMIAHALRPAARVARDVNRFAGHEVN